MGGGLRRSDEVAMFYHIKFNAFKLEFFHLISRLCDSFPSRGSLDKFLQMYFIKIPQYTEAD